MLSDEEKVSERGIPAADGDSDPAVVAAADLPHLPVLHFVQGFGVLGRAVAEPADAEEFRPHREAEALLPVSDLGAEAGLGQAALGARRSRAHRRRDAAAAVPPGVPAPDDALDGGDRHLRAAAGLERIPLRLPAAVA